MSIERHDTFFSQKKKFAARLFKQPCVLSTPTELV